MKHAVKKLDRDKIGRYIDNGNKKERKGDTETKQILLCSDIELYCKVRKT